MDSSWLCSPRSLIPVPLNVQLLALHTRHVKQRWPMSGVSIAPAPSASPNFFPLCEACKDQTAKSLIALCENILTVFWWHLILEPFFICQSAEWYYASICLLSYLPHERHRHHEANDDCQHLYRKPQVIDWHLSPRLFLGPASEDGSKVVCGWKKSDSATVSEG